MRINASQSRITRLLRYPIASADMYYSEVNERDVCVSDDPIYGFYIWGEIPGLGEKTAVDLCEVFLEYAMTCTGMRDRSWTLQSMEAFGERLGESLASYIKASTPMETKQNLGECSLECVLEAMNAHFVVEQRDTESRYILKRCPLCVASKRNGLPYADLAHFGINKLCQSLIHILDPFLVVYTPADSETDHIYSVVKPAFA